NQRSAAPVFLVNISNLAGPGERISHANRRKKFDLRPPVHQARQRCWRNREFPFVRKTIRPQFILWDRIREWCHIKEWRGDESLITAALGVFLIHIQWIHIICGHSKPLDVESRHFDGPWLGLPTNPRTNLICHERFLHHRRLPRLKYGLCESTFLA